MFVQKGRLVLVLVFLFLYVPFLTDHGFRSAQVENIDLPSFYYAVDTTFNQHASPYQPGSWEGLQNELGPKVFPYLYPPSSLLLLAPYAWFSYEGLKILVLVVNHACVLLLMYLLFFRIFSLVWPGGKSQGSDQGVLGWFLLPLLVLYTLQFHPLVVTLVHGQINLVVMVLICLFWLALRARSNPLLVGLPLAAAILLKTYPILFLPLLLIRRRFRVTACTIGYVAIVVGISTLILPGKAWTDWLNLVLPTGGYAQTPYHLFSPAMPWNQSLNGVAARMFLHPNYAFSVNPGLARLAPYLAAAGIMGTLVWLGIKLTKRHETRYVNDEFVLVLLSIFLVAPLSWEHHLVFVLPAALLALVQIVGGLPDNRGEHGLEQFVTAVFRCAGV